MHREGRTVLRSLRSEEDERNQRGVVLDVPVVPDGPRVGAALPDPDPIFAPVSGDEDGEDGEEDEDPDDDVPGVVVLGPDPGPL